MLVPVFTVAPIYFQHLPRIPKNKNPRNGHYDRLGHFVGKSGYVAFLDEVENGIHGDKYIKCMERGRTGTSRHALGLECDDFSSPAELHPQAATAQKLEVGRLPRPEVVAIQPEPLMNGAPDGLDMRHDDHVTLWTRHSRNPGEEPEEPLPCGGAAFTQDARLVVGVLHVEAIPNTVDLEGVREAVRDLVEPRERLRRVGHMDRAERRLDPNRLVSPLHVIGLHGAT